MHFMIFEDDILGHLTVAMSEVAVFNRATAVEGLGCQVRILGCILRPCKGRQGDDVASGRL